MLRTMRSVNGNIVLEFCLALETCLFIHTHVEFFFVRFTALKTTRDGMSFVTF